MKLVHFGLDSGKTVFHRDTEESVKSRPFGQQVVVEDFTFDSQKFLRTHIFYLAAVDGGPDVCNPRAIFLYTVRRFVVIHAERSVYFAYI